MPRGVTVLRLTHRSALRKHTAASQSTPQTNEVVQVMLFGHLYLPRLAQRRTPLRSFALEQPTTRTPTTSTRTRIRGLHPPALFYNW
jgi:hypothetical protein